jgi:hypothetical protein
MPLLFCVGNGKIESRRFKVNHVVKLLIFLNPFALRLISWMRLVIPYISPDVTQLEITQNAKPVFSNSFRKIFYWFDLWSICPDKSFFNSEFCLFSVFNVTINILKCEFHLINFRSFVVLKTQRLKFDSLWVCKFSGFLRQT